MLPGANRTVELPGADRTVEDDQVWARSPCEHDPFPASDRQPLPDGEWVVARQVPGCDDLLAASKLVLVVDNGHGQRTLRVRADGAGVGKVPPCYRTGRRISHGSRTP
jgi:hypothetical protein